MGNIPEDKLEDIKNALRKAASGFSPMEIGLKGAGAFPSIRRPNVLWIGLNCPLETGELYSKLQSSLAPLGFEHDNRAFKPHLTIGRVRRGTGRPRQVIDTLTKMEDIELGSFRTTGITLMKSELKPGGPIHTRLATISLSYNQ